MIPLEGIRLPRDQRLALASVVNGFRQRTIKGPLQTVKPVAKSAGTYSHALRPSSGSVCDAGMRQAQRSRVIRRLHDRRSPSTVVAGVVAVAVNAIQGVRWRWFGAHVGQEALEGIDPASTNGDAAPTVVAVLRGVRIQASALHGAPRSVFGRVRSSVRSAPRPTHLSVVAATRHDVPAPEGRDSGIDRGLAAVTRALPIVPGLVVSQGHKSSKSLAGKVGWSGARHAPIIA